MDPGVRVHFQSLFAAVRLTVITDIEALPEALSQHPYDVVMVQSRSRTPISDTLIQSIDPSRTLLVIGSASTLKRTSKLIQLVSRKQPLPPHGAARDLSLEDYLDLKMDEFIRGIRHGAAKNLHPMLISALERPLISLALRETDGNQIQAAELLGLNRNTLRKKITDLEIPIKRTRSKTSRVFSDGGI